MITTERLQKLATMAGRETRVEDGLRGPDLVFVTGRFASDLWHPHEDINQAFEVADALGINEINFNKHCSHLLCEVLPPLDGQRSPWIETFGPTRAAALCDALLQVPQ